MASKIPEVLRQAGLDALRRDLGAVGVARFLQQFELGTGDYTADRWQWLPRDANVEFLADAIRQRTGHGKQSE